MHDKRVVRGSTHAAMVIPAGTYPDALFSQGSPGKGSMKGTKRGKSGRIVRISVRN
jgi:hypothetical protein